MKNSNLTTNCEKYFTNVDEHFKLFFKVYRFEPIPKIPFCSLTSFSYNTYKNALSFNLSFLLKVVNEGNKHPSLSEGYFLNCALADLEGNTWQRGKQ